MGFRPLQVFAISVTVGLVTALLVFGRIDQATADSARELPDVLEAPQESSDEISVSVLDGLAESRLRGDTAQLLHDDGTRQIYASLSEAGDACLIAVVQSPQYGEVSAATCGAMSNFNEHGLPLKLIAGEASAAAVLVPDGYALSSVEDSSAGNSSSSLESLEVENNAIIFDSAYSLPERIMLESIDGRAMTVELFDE